MYKYTHACIYLRKYVVYTFKLFICNINYINIKIYMGVFSKYILYVCLCVYKYIIKYTQNTHLHLHLVILQTLLSKATYNWGIHKAINLEEANKQRKCP